MFACDICNSKYTNEQNLKMHKQHKHKNHQYKWLTPVNCQECGKHFTAKAGLKRHINNVHKRIKYKCDQCDKTFSLPS